MSEHEQFIRFSVYRISKKDFLVICNTDFSTPVMLTITCLMCRSKSNKGKFYSVCRKYTFFTVLMHLISGTREDRPACVGKRNSPLPSYHSRRQSSLFNVQF
jgi:hypothetical protein